MASLSIQLLGSFKVWIDGELVTHFPTDKIRGLFAYLVIESDRAHARTALADLFWPDYPENVARRNLRLSLHRLRATIEKKSSDVSFFDVTRNEIQFRLPIDYRLDVDEFHKAARVLSTLTANTSLDAQQEQYLSRAAECYQGPLLPHLFLNDSAPFEEWLLLTREQLQQQVRQILHHLIDHHEVKGDFRAACQYTQKLVGLEPWDEAAHRTLMRLYFALGDREAALAQYEQCERILADELGVEPTAETQSLYQDIQLSRTIHNRLPTPTTPFIGRENEQEELRQRLNDPGCRLLTLVGPGGIGKTRLAIQLAAQQQDFLHGVVFVGLSAVTKPENLVHTIAQSLDLTFLGGANQTEQLGEFLAEKELLLLLDNMEQLLPGGAAIIGELIARAPGLKILATSRIRLQLQAEYVYPIDGFSYPQAVDSMNMGHIEPSIGSPVTKERDALPQANPALAYEAVRFFVENAIRSQPDFALTPDVEPYVIQISQLVQGMPLAIELASAWLPYMTCAEIVYEIERGLDLLTTDVADVPQRHRSVRTVVQQSLALLNPLERSTFLTLSIFRGGFSREAAVAVTDASAPTLVRLIAHSLLRRNRSGRYELHELLRQVAAEELERKEVVTDVHRVWAAHATYYTELAYHHTDALRLQQAQEALTLFEVDGENLRAAWLWAVNAERFELTEKMLPALVTYYDIIGQYAGVSELLQPLLETNGALRAKPQLLSTLLLIRVQTWQGYFALQMGETARSERLLQESLELLDLDDLDDSAYERALTLWVFSAVWVVQGDYTKAAYYVDEARLLATSLNELWLQGMVTFRQGQIAQHSGDFVQAHKYFEQSLVIQKQIGNQREVANSYMALGSLASLMSERDEAVIERMYTESLEIFRDIGDRRGVSASLNRLGMAARNQGQYSLAHTRFSESLAFSQELGAQYDAAVALNNLGWVAELQQAYAEAEAHYSSSLAIFQKLGNPDAILVVLTNLGEILWLMGKPDQAEAYLQEALALYLKHDNPASRAYTLKVLAKIKQSSGANSLAYCIYMDALDAARSGSNLLEAVRIILELATLYADTQDNEPALCCLAFVQNHSRTMQDELERCLSLQEEVTAKLPSDLVARSYKRGASWDLDHLSNYVARTKLLRDGPN